MNYKLSDNKAGSTFETFETNSSNEVMGVLRTRLKDNPNSKDMVFVLLDRSENLEKTYSWNSELGCLDKLTHRYLDGPHYWNTNVNN